MMLRKAWILLTETRNEFQLSFTLAIIFATLHKPAVLLWLDCTHCPSIFSQYKQQNNLLHPAHSITKEETCTSYPFLCFSCLRWSFCFSKSSKWIWLPSCSNVWLHTLLVWSAFPVVFHLLWVTTDSLKSWSNAGTSSFRKAFSCLALCKLAATSSEILAKAWGQFAFVRCLTKVSTAFSHWTANTYNFAGIFIIQN